MKVFGKLFSIILCFLMLVSIIPTQILAQEESTLTGQALVDEGLIEDINFANAIADSINNTPTFESGKLISEFDSLEAILNDYTGIINAQNKGITSIKGFHHIRKALEVHLENNQIRDLTPIADGHDPSDDVYYGQGSYDKRNKKSIKILVDGNPLFIFPDEMGGSLDFADFDEQ